nr:hypothetical protein [Morchella crassipes]
MVRPNPPPEPPLIGDERVLGAPRISPPPSEMGGGGGPHGGWAGGLPHSVIFSTFPPPRPLRIPPPPTSTPKALDLRSRVGNPPLSPQIFIFKFFPRPLRRRSGTARGGKKNQEMKRGATPPPFSNYYACSSYEKGGPGERGRGPWVVGGGKVEKNFFL